MSSDYDLKLLPPFSPHETHFQTSEKSIVKKNTYRSLCVSDFKAPQQQPILIVSLKILCLAGHSGKQAAYCVQVLLCLLHQARLLDLTKYKSTQWAGDGQEGTQPWEIPHYIRRDTRRCSVWVCWQLH